MAEPKTTLDAFLKYRFGVTPESIKEEAEKHHALVL